MKPALLIAILVIAAVVTFVVVVLRSTLRMQRESNAFLREFAFRVGATIEREDPARLTGERDGRRFIVTRRHVSGRDGESTQTWIEVPVNTAIHLEIQPQDSDATSTISLDDSAFDTACLLRTTAPEAAARALDAPMRELLADGCRRELRLLVVRKQWLRLELRGAPDVPEHEAMVTRYLEAALRLAGRLDAA